jgi:hypothetical protein
MENKKIYMVTELTETTNEPQVAQQPISRFEHPRFTRLPNPSIPYEEYVLASRYCDGFANMARVDWMELAIIEKLHNDKMITDEYFNKRRIEICNRPPRGQRKNTKKK